MLELRCYLHSKLPPYTLNTVITWGSETLFLTFFDHERLYHETSLFLHKITGEIWGEILVNRNINSHADFLT